MTPHLGGRGPGHFRAVLSPDEVVSFGYLTEARGDRCNSADRRHVTPNGTSSVSLFSSSQERRLWLWTLALVVTIYSTLGLAGSLAGVLGDRGLNAATFVLGGLLVMAAVATQGLNRRPGTTEIFVAVGVAALYVLVFTRMTSVVERSHLMEYGVVAVLIYAALTERARNGRRVPFPPLLAILITAVIGAVDEFIQTALPNRVFDPIDIVFNTAAAVMAVAAGGALAWARRRRLQRRAEPETGQPY